MPEILARLFPPLQAYVPADIFQQVSPQQALFLLTDCREAFYGGAVGGGKSAALLMGALQYADVPGYRALILRRTFAQLAKGDALIPLSREWLAGTDAVWNEQRKTWLFPSGATVEFGHVQDAHSMYDYQGAAYQYVGFDELTQFPEEVYQYIAFSRQRRRTQLARVGVPVRVRATANPGGVGHAWVRRRFVDERDPAVVFIPARVWDNPGLDAADYELSLMHLPDTLRKQLMDGDWGAFEGAAYPWWDDALHVVEPFEPPQGWDRMESMDFGTTNPTAWLAWAVDYDGNLVCYDELYEPGLPSETAPRLKERQAAWYGDGVDVPTAIADPSVYAKSGTTNRWGRPARVADEFSEFGVALRPGNNDRCAGYVRLAELTRLDPLRRFPAWHPLAGRKGAPRMFVFSHCRNLVTQMRAAPLEAETEPHPGEAVSRRWERPYGHAHAAARYGVLAWPDPSAYVKPAAEDPRRAFLDQLEQSEREPEPFAARRGYVTV